MKIAICPSKFPENTEKNSYIGNKTANINLKNNAFTMCMATDQNNKIH